LLCQCQSPAKARQGKAGQLLPQPASQSPTCKGGNAQMGRGYYWRKVLQLVLTRLTWLFWQPRRSKAGYLGLYISISVPCPFPSFSLCCLSSLLQSLFGCVSEKPSGNFVTGLGVKSRSQNLRKKI